MKGKKADRRNRSEDRTDPICGMRGTLPAHGKWFCSNSCVRKYEKEMGIPMEESHEYCPECQMKHAKWYHERLYQVTVCILLILSADFALKAYGYFILAPFTAAFYEYLGLMWAPMLVGLIIGGIIDYYVPREYISKYLASSRKRTVFYAVGFGFLMSACSHGILAIAIQLYKKGASVPAVIAFLLASPWANLPVTILLFGFFGAKVLLFVVSAVVIAMITGIIYQLLDTAGAIERNPRTANVKAGFSIRADVRRRLKGYRLTPNSITVAIRGIGLGGWGLAKMVMWWVLIGAFFAAFARTYIPTEVFHEYMGPTIFGLFVTLVLATVIEVCSEGSAPLAFEIYHQTHAFGNAFAFLMAGVATDYTEIGLIWSNIGKRSAIFLPIITVPQILFLAWLFNLLL